MKQLLVFGKGNAKLSKKIATFSLPAGHSCPFAKDCLTKVSRASGELEQDGNLFRCFAASQELLYPNVRKSRWHNFDLLKGKSKEDMAALINASIPKKAEIIRIHVSGDFFSQDYLDAWIEVARQNPKRVFYAYTKSIKFWIARFNSIPENLRLNASYGSRHDNLIEAHNLKSAKVVFTEQEAEEKGLDIDHDDSLAAFGKESFALLLHGVQKAGSAAAKAWSILRKQGKGGYSK